MATTPGSNRYKFQYLESKTFDCLNNNKDIQELLKKWSMKDRMKIQAYSFDQQFQSYAYKDFVNDFFQDDVVCGSLLVASSDGSWGCVGNKATSVDIVPVPCTCLSMNLFDRLLGAVHKEDGALTKCFDEFCGDFTISDELRKMLLLEDSDHYELYDDEEKEEFLFHLFRHLCLGGAVCQYEDNANPYLDVTKTFYKDLINVQKDPQSQKLNIVSLVYKVMASDETSVYFPSWKEHEQTFAYLIVDPVRRHVSVFQHQWGGGVWS